MCINKKDNKPKIEEEMNNQLAILLVIFLLHPQMSDPKIKYQIGRVDGNFSKIPDPTAD